MAQQSFIDKYVRRSVDLLRAAEGEANDVADALRVVFDEVVSEMQKSPRLTKQSSRQLQAKITTELEKFYGSSLPAALQTTAVHVIERELKWNFTAIFDEVAKEISLPNKKAVAARAASKTFQGHTFDFWTKKEFGKNAKAVNAILKQGYVESQSIGEIEKQLAQVSGRARRDVRTIVRNSFMHNATEAREQAFAINPSIVEGAIWVSVLDNRTTPLICGIRDGLLYDEERNPVGHNIPWLDGPGRIHWGCRSVAVPKLVGIDYDGTRAATEAGENYERGDGTTRTGRVRKNTKDARERGIFKTEEYTTKTRYEGWLRRQSKSNIDYVSDILGSKRKARDFRDGKITLTELGLESPVARPTNRNSI